MTDLERIRHEAKVRDFERVHGALMASGGNVAKATRLYSDAAGIRPVPISRAAFYRLLDKHGISRPRRASPH